jgi:hypothetical protein
MRSRVWGWASLKKLNCKNVLLHVGILDVYCWDLIFQKISKKKKGCSVMVVRDLMSIIMSPLRTKGDILFKCDFFFRFFCFFSAKLVRTITFLSFQIGHLYLACGCMNIRRCVVYRNDIHGTLTFDHKVK